MRLLLPLCLMLATPAIAQADEVFATPEPPPHPRLLATAADFERIRSTITQPGPLRDAFALLLATGEREYAEPPFEREVVGRRMLAVSRNALRRILNFSLLHRLTDDPRWAARAEREMLALAAFTDWNPSHFLDTAEAATAVAIGYDWTHDALSPEARHAIRDALVRHALRPGDADDLWWRKRGTANNWLQVCEAGLALAGLAIAEDEPALAARAVARARHNVPAIFATYEPAGSYVEGPMYWDYGTTYHVLLIEALRTATGSAGDLAAHEPFLQSAAAVNHLTAPSGDFYNFGDCVPRRLFMPAMYWFARETHRPDLVATEHTTLAALPDDGLVRSDNTPFPPRFLAVALLWMPPGPAPTPAPPQAAWSTAGPNPLAVFRAGEGRDALYVAMKGGRARNSHGHMDAGSFILELGGVRWAVDSGMPSYHELERQGVALFGKDRWSVYVLGPHSHSVPLIDDRLPDELATATLLAFDAEARSATFDLGPLYPGQVRQLHRKIRIESPDTISIGDIVTGAAPGARYRFSWMTRAKVETDATGATLRQNGQTLRLDFTADAPFEIVNDDASRPPAAHDAPQPGLRRVSALFTVQNPAHFIEVRASLR